ncbi:hypothetical protein LOTGIDRAFT_115667, partial [Lottia gigantea]
FSLEKPPEFKGPLEPNTLLQKASRLYLDEVKGPESIVVDGGKLFYHVYTGTMDGKVIDIFQGHVKVLAQLGKPPCGKFEDEPTCGRPLGLKLDKEGYLIVVDAYLGLYRINVATGNINFLFDSKEKILGYRPVFLNDVVILKDGTMYITDSSRKWDRRHHPYSILEAEDSGRLLKFSKGKMTEEVTGISFANGVVLSKNEDFVLICETTKARILKYHLSGNKKGELEIWSDNLPGLPDNIRPTSRGTYWVGLTGVRRADKFNFLDFVCDKPWIKTLVTKVLSMDLIKKVVPKYGLLIEVNSEGKIVRSLHDPTGEKIPAISEAEEHNGVIYLGSYNLPYISKLYVNDLK